MLGGPWPRSLKVLVYNSKGCGFKPQHQCLVSLGKALKLSRMFFLFNCCKNVLCFKNLNLENI